MYHHLFFYGLMAIAAATYCVVFGFGPVFLAWACIRRMSQKIAASRRRKRGRQWTSTTCVPGKA